MSQPTEILIPAATLADLAEAIRTHLSECPRDHRAVLHQTQLVVFDMLLSTLTCPICGQVETLNKPPVEGGKLDTYVCHLLRQQQSFYDLHFESCVPTQGGIA